MFERFTERARKVIVAAQNQAQHFNHDYIGTEHILLGLLHEKGGGSRHRLWGGSASPSGKRMSGWGA
ncbi:MAG: hypothetical protein M3494_00585 [Actinomycetota bacterium]|nr:hypothetical protein [Actinomycetota bacterium]